MIILSSTLPCAVAEEKIITEDENDYPIFEWFTNNIDRFAKWLFRQPYILRTKLLGLILGAYGVKKFFPWFIAQLQTPVYFKAEPGTIDIRYLNTTDVVISSPNFQLWPLADVDYLKFRIDLPDEISDEYIDYRLDPGEVLYPKKDEIPKVNLRIITNFPSDFDIPNQFILKVNITRVQIINFIARNAFINELEKIEETGEEITIVDIFIKLFLAAGYLQFQKIVGGKRYQYSDIDLLVKENRFHLLRIIPPKKVEISANEVKSIPFKIINLGSHTDIFKFNATAPEESNLELSPPNALALEPNEERIVYLGVGTPIRFQDLGSLYNIKIQAVSMYDNNSVFENSIGIVTRGVYVSGALVFYSIAILPILLLIFIYIYIKRRRYWNTFCVKPDKPWDIPIERENLERLKKQKEKTKYNETWKRLEEEYKSSILWYKGYCKAVVNKSDDKPFDIFETLQNLTKSSMGAIANIPRLFKIKTKKSKKVKKQSKTIKSKKKLVLSDKKIKKPLKSEKIVKISKEKIKPITKETNLQKQKLKKTITRIVNEQEKQKKKLNSQ